MTEGRKSKGLRKDKDSEEMSEFGRNACEEKRKDCKKIFGGVKMINWWPFVFSAALR